MARALLLQIRFRGEAAASASVPRMWHAGRLDREPLPSMRREPDVFHGGHEPLAFEVPAVAIASHLSDSRRMLHSLWHKPAARNSLRLSCFTAGWRHECAIRHRLHPLPDSAQPWSLPALALQSGTTVAFDHRLFSAWQPAPYRIQYVGSHRSRPHY